MTNEQLLFLSKAFTADRKAVSAGSYEFDLTVNVRGTMSVGEDYQTSNSAPYAKILARLVQIVGTGKLKKALATLDEMTESDHKDTLTEIRKMCPDFGKSNSSGKVQVVSFHEQLDFPGSDDESLEFVFDEDLA